MLDQVEGRRETGGTVGAEQIERAERRVDDLAHAVVDDDLVDIVRRRGADFGAADRIGRGEIVAVLRGEDDFLVLGDVKVAVFERLQDRDDARIDNGGKLADGGDLLVEIVGAELRRPAPSAWRRRSAANPAMDREQQR